MIARLEGVEAAGSALHYVAPVGEKDEYVARAMRNISPYHHADLAYRLIDAGQVRMRTTRRRPRHHQRGPGLRILDDLALQAVDRFDQLLGDH